MDKARKKQQKFLRSKRRQVAFVLWAENLASAFFPFLIMLAFLSGLFLIAEPVFAGSTSHKFIALLSLLFLFGFIIRGFKYFHKPTKRDVDIRLEQVSALQNSPLYTLDDDLPEEEKDPARIRLWELHKTTLFQSIAVKLRSGPPKFAFSVQDPYAFGIFAVLLLITGFFIAGESWNTRLSNSFIPFSSEQAVASFAPSVKMTVIPPAYTREKKHQIDLSKRYKKPIQLLEGTKIEALYQTKYRKPKVRLGDENIPFEEIEENVYRVKFEPKGSDRIKFIQYGVTRYSLPIEIKQDEKPSIEIGGIPEITQDSQILIPMKLKDDISIEAVALEVGLAPYGDKKLLGTPPHIERTLALLTKEKTLDITEKFDLTSHPWAGQPVLMTLIVTDGKGQTARTNATLPLKLPERNFYHPVARKIISYRRLLITTPSHKRFEIADKLLRLRNNLFDYQGDQRVFLALTSAARRLHYDGEDKANRLGVINLLWNTSLRIEDGDFVMALRDVRKQKQDFLKLFANQNASAQEKMAALQDLQNSLNEFWSELGKELQKRLANGEQIPMNMSESANSLDPGLLNDFLEQMMNELAQGNGKKAEEMLAQLQNFMDMLDPANAQSLTPEMRELMEAMAGLSDIVSEQRQLMEETKTCEPPKDNESEATCSSPDGSEQNGKSLGKEQAKLQEQLSSLNDMIEKNNAPLKNKQSLREAEDAMKMAKQKLEKGLFDEASTFQQEALNKLEQASQELQKQIANQMQNNGGFPFSFGGQNRDPFGRQQDSGQGFGADKNVLPAEAERKRVQEILQKLRERASERQRPLLERDYYKRLLQQW